MKHQSTTANHLDQGEHICFTANRVESTSVTLGPNGPIKHYTIQKLPAYVSNETDFWRCLWSVSLTSTGSHPSGCDVHLVQGSWSSLSLCFISKDAWPWHWQMTKIRMKCSSWWFIMIVWNLKSPEVPRTTLFTLYITFYWRVVCTWFNLLHRPVQYKHPLVNQYFDFPESKIICMYLGSSDSQDEIHSVQRTQGAGLGNFQSFCVCLHFLSHAVSHLLPLVKPMWVHLASFQQLSDPV